MNLYVGIGALALAGGTVLFGLYLAGFRNGRQVRGLSALVLFFSAMSMWQLGVALLGDLAPKVHANVAYGAAFGVLGAIAQAAQVFKRRGGDERRAATA